MTAASKSERVFRECWIRTKWYHPKERPKTSVVVGGVVMGRGVHGSRRRVERELFQNIIKI